MPRRAPVGIRTSLPAFLQPFAFGVSRDRALFRGRKALVYVRVSSKPQGRDDRYGPTTQWEAAVDACARVGLRDPKRFEDHVTGTEAQRRTDFQALIAEAKQRGPKGVVLVYDVSRFARAEEDAWVYVRALVRARSLVWFLTEDFVAGPRSLGADEDWEGLFGKYVNEAAGLSRTISRKVRKANEIKWTMDHGYNGVPPIGYRWTANKKTIEPDPRTIGTRVRIFKLWNTGRFRSTVQLALHLRSIGLKIRTYDRADRKWVMRTPTGDGLAKIIRNPVVIGTLTYTRSLRDAGDPTNKADVHEGAIRAVITKQAWKRAQALLDEHRLRIVTKDRPRNARTTYVFRGALCLRCRERKLADANKATFHGHLTTTGYRRLIHSPDYGCRKGVRGEDYLERVLARWFAGFHLPDEVKRTLAQMAAPSRTMVVDDEAERRALRAELDRLPAKLVREEISDEEFVRRRREIKEQLATKSNVYQLPMPRLSADELDLLDKVLPSFHERSVEWKAALVRELFSRVWLGEHGVMEVEIAERYAPFVRASLGEGPNGTKRVWRIQHVRAGTSVVA